MGRDRRRGGPGGSTTAWQLARGGAKVLACSTELSAPTPEAMRRVGDAHGVARSSSTLENTRGRFSPSGGRASELDGEVLETSWDHTVSYGIVRREFDEFLLRRAEQAGAVVREGERVLGVERDARRRSWSVRAKSRIGRRSWSARAAITVRSRDRSARSPTTRRGGDARERDPGRRRPAAELTSRHGEPELFAEPDFRGYGWYFTKGDF